MGNLKEFLPNVQIEKNILDKQDKAIAIEVVQENSISTIALANVSIYENFSISTAFEPESGGGRFSHCGCCGLGCNPSNNCINCPGPSFTLCHPNSTIICGI